MNGSVPMRRTQSGQDDSRRLLPLIHESKKKKRTKQRKSSARSTTTLGNQVSMVHDDKRSENGQHVYIMRLLRLVCQSKTNHEDNNAYLYTTLQYIQQQLQSNASTIKKLMAAMHEAVTCLIHLNGIRSKQYNTIQEATGELLKYSSIQIGHFLKLPIPRIKQDSISMAHSLWTNWENIYKGDLLLCIHESLSTQNALYTVWIWTYLGILYILLRNFKLAKRYLKCATKLNAMLMTNMEVDDLNYPMLHESNEPTLDKLQKHTLFNIFLKLLFFMTMQPSEKQRMVDHLKKALHLKGYNATLYLKLKIFFYIMAGNLMEQNEYNQWLLIANSLFVSNHDWFATKDREWLQLCFPVQLQLLQNQTKTTLPSLKTRVRMKAASTTLLDTTLNRQQHRIRKPKVLQHFQVEKGPTEDEKHEAAMKIQMWWTQLLLKRKGSSYSSMFKRINATLTIQRFYRGCLSRQKQLQQRKAKTIMLKTIKRFLAYKKVERIEIASIMIQSWYRQYREMNTINKRFQAAISIQSWWRMIQGRKCQRIVMAAANKIQPVIRGYLVRRDLELKKRASSFLVRTYRLINVRRKLKAIVVIIFHWRGYKTWLQYRVKISSAITIQCCYRKYKALQMVNQRRRAATRIQAIFRGNRDRTSFLRFKKAFPTLMAMLFGYLTRIRIRLKSRACLEIQRVWRGYRERKKRHAKISAATRILGILKMKKEQRERGHYDSAIHTLQIHFIKQIVNEKLHLENKMATKIQGVYLGKSVRHRLFIINIAATLIQANVRGFLAIHHLQQEQEAATSINAFIKGVLFRKKNIIREKAVLLIQRWYRGRCVAAKELRRVWACNKIRAWYKGEMDRLELHNLTQTTMRIQLSYKTHLARCRIKKERMILETCGRILKGVSVRLHLRRQRRAVLTLQCFYRYHNSRFQFCQKKKAANDITAWFKGILRRREKVIQFQAARIIQHQARIFVVCCRIQRIHKSVRILQYWWRGAREHYRFVTMKRATLLLQSYCRGFLTRKRTVRYQPIFRQYLHNRHKRIQYNLYLQQECATRTIQRAWAKYKNTPYFKKRSLSREQLYDLISLVQASLRRFAVQIPNHNQQVALLKISNAFLFYKQGKKNFAHREQAALRIQRTFALHFQKKYGITLRSYIHRQHDLFKK